MTWARVHESINNLSRLELNWDSHGSPGPSIAVIENAHKLADFCARHGAAPAHDVYPLPGNAIVLEWQLSGDTITRAEATDAGFGEFMVTYRDTNAPAHFIDITDVVIMDFLPQQE